MSSAKHIVFLERIQQYLLFILIFIKTYTARILKFIVLSPIIPHDLGFLEGPSGIPLYNNHNAWRRTFATFFESPISVAARE